MPLSRCQHPWVGRVPLSRMPFIVRGRRWRAGRAGGRQGSIARIPAGPDSLIGYGSDAGAAANGSRINCRLMNIAATVRYPHKPPCVS